MEIVYVLIPLSVILLVIAVVVFMWATNSGQFEDLDSPAWRILRDEETRGARKQSPRCRNSIKDNHNGS